MNIEALFRCPTCGAGRLVAREAALVCDTCATHFPEVGGIPLLVKNPTAHDAAIREAQAVNPEWYLAEQPPEETSPWRHHVRKRRRYVEQVLRREFTKRGWQQPALAGAFCGTAVRQ